MLLLHIGARIPRVVKIFAEAGNGRAINTVQ